MRKIAKIFPVILIILLFNNVAVAREPLPKLFLFIGGDEAISHQDALKNTYVTGAQIIYSWRQLEPKKDVYNFSKIENDLKFLKKINKKLFIQLQDRSFDPNVYNVPDYILEEKIYHGGVAMQYDVPGEGKPITSGWVARVWDPAVRKRFQLLINRLAKQFDGRIYGINLPETAVDFDINNLPEGFTADDYFFAELENIAELRKAFHKNIVIQYVNFFPSEWGNDHRYMSRLFTYAVHHNIGLGGPDVVPYKTTHMKNSYPFFHQLRNKVIMGMAVQEPDYTYRNASTGEPYNFFDFYNFAREYLNANIVFWNVSEPSYSNQLKPRITQEYFML